VDALDVCIDLPVDPAPAVGAPAADIGASMSPAEYSFLRNTGKITPEELSGEFEAALQEAAGALDIEKTSGPQEAAFKNYWEGRHVLNVCFLDGSTKQKITAMKQANKWAEFANIEFKETSISQSDIRVTFRVGGGHKSLVGTDATGSPGRPTMNLSMSDATVDGAYNLGVIIHEFGHALGLVHEHQSPGAGGIQFKPANQLLGYFAPRGLNTVALIEHNVVRRYKATELKKFSEFDPDSIMLYSFPPELTTNNKGTKQNTVLSKKDHEYAALLYGSRSGTTQPVTPVPSGQPKTLTLGGEAVEGRLAAGVTQEFTFTVPSDHNNKPLVIETTGATQLMLTLAGSDGKDLTPAGKPQHGTYDLMNEILALPLAAGTYKVTATHPSTKGGGDFKIQARKGTSERKLAAPIRKL
jgi:hypothetical protein